MQPSTAILVRVGRVCYALAIAGIGFQLFFYGEFHPVIFPAWPGIPVLRFWVYAAGTLLIAATLAILLNKNGRKVSLLLGAFLFVLLCFGHIPYEFIIDPNSKHHLGLWTNALKELALSGGAFVIAGSFTSAFPKPVAVKLLEKVIPAGPVFFSITMICFGIGHFMYIQFVSLLVPGWVPDPIFWTYLAGVALIAAGIAIILEIRVRRIGILLGAMIFLWLILLHLPSSVANPFGDKGNEVTSAYTALAFSGIAFVIAGMQHTKKDSLS